MTEAVRDCLAGTISPQVAISRMLLGGMDASAIADAVQAARPGAPDQAWSRLAALLDGRADELDGLAAQIRESGSDHTSMGGVAGIAAFFDRAAAHSPEAGVALYSLGDPAILDAATAEIAGWLAEGSLLPSGARVLDLGCGIGRIAAALVARGCSVLGLDVSPGMVAEARRRHPATPGLQFTVSDGRTLPAGPFDLVLLVDSMPYIHQAGLAGQTIAGIAGALRPGGALVVLNLCYGRDPASDRAEAARWAEAHGWAFETGQPFQLWDGKSFVFRSSASPCGPGDAFAPDRGH